ncbi:hypothetical protein [Cupriavidus campinensis]|uniref:Uncharacterized protein n=1 Tax=Cupriavidus campinensis TaxID=151783 RepID=A0AAE9L1N9_9BURK|nr:hypothetical protein [Cupriavidus campinensis]URF03836.1 hypothetical protein M5D45_15240 [Cupriavidus campinensis]
MIQHEIPVIGGEDGEVVLITQFELDDECGLNCVFRGRAIEALEGDYFDALCEIRKILESENIIPFCYGASLNVYPSAMARQMGEGLRAYRLTMGVPSSQDQLVQIFDQGPDIIPASVSHQEQFYREWCMAGKAS